MSRAVKTRGFTLIELLVVVFIIGILIAATLTIVGKVKQKVYETQTSAQLSAIAAAIQQYYNDFRAYPGPLPNNQICAGIDDSNTSLSVVPFIPDPSNSSNPPFTLKPITTLSSATFQSDCIPAQSTSTFNSYITGSQNLTLGLLGGLELSISGGVVNGFVYNPQDIFSDGVVPAPRGAASLNFNNPKRQQAYMQVKPGDLSTPRNSYNMGQGAGFADEAGRTTSNKSQAPAASSLSAYGEAMIPVFLDKYSNPLPILYYRTNVGGTAIVGFRNMTTPGGSTTIQDQTLQALGNTNGEIAQYDLNQNLPYTASAIGTIGNNPNSYHGLVGITSAGNMGNQYLFDNPSSPQVPPIDTIDYLSNGHSVPTNGGANGLAYFRDPTLNVAPTAAPTSSSPANGHLGVPRQKDGYILISAGPDRLYGTHDDTVYPGPLQP